MTATALILPSRRGFLGLLVSAFAAPAIVQASSLMPIRALQAAAANPLQLDEFAARVCEARFDALAKTVLDDLEIAECKSHLLFTQIARESVKLFVNSNSFIQNVNTQFDEHFAADNTKIGSSLRIRLPSSPYKVLS